MTMVGNLTQLLKPEYREQGYTLSEDEDYLYLFRNDERQAVFSSHGATIERVHSFIESRNIRLNVQDYWSHLGNAD